MAVGSNLVLIHKQYSGRGSIIIGNHGNWQAVDAMNGSGEHSSLPIHASPIIEEQRVVGDVHPLTGTLLDIEGSGREGDLVTESPV